MSLFSINGKKKRNKKPDQKLMLTITQGRAGQSEMFGAIFYKIFYKKTGVAGVKGDQSC